MDLLQRIVGRDGNGWTRVLVAVSLWALLVLVVLTLSPLQIVGVMFAMAAAFGLVLRPMYGLFVLIALRVIVDLLWFMDFSFLGLRLTELYAGVGALGVGVLLLLRFDEVGKHPIVVWFLGLLLLLIVAAVRVGGGGAAQLVRIASPPMVLVAMSIYVRRNPDAWRYLWVFALAGCIPLARSAYAIGSGTGYEIYAGVDRLLGGYQNATNHALIVALFAQVGVLGLLAYKDRWMRVGIGLYTALAFLAVRESYNRSSVVAMAVFLVLLLLFEKRWRLLGLMVPAALLFIAFNEVMQDRFLEIFTTTPSYATSAEDAGSGRWGLWTSSLRHWTSRPAWELFLGMGLGRHFIGHGTTDPHNDYLAVTYQAGPLATIAMATILGRGALLSVRAGRRATDERTRLLAHFVAASTIAAMITSFVTNGYIVRSSAAWYLFAITGLGYGLWMRTEAQVAGANAPVTPAAPSPHGDTPMHRGLRPSG